MVSGLIPSHWQWGPRHCCKVSLVGMGGAHQGLMGFVFADAEIDGFFPAAFISLHRWQIVKFQVLTSLSSDWSLLAFLTDVVFLSPHADLPLTHFHMFRVFVKAKEATTLFISQCFVCQSFVRIHEELHSQFCPVNREQLSYFFWLFFFLAAKAPHWVFYWSDRLCFQKACFWPAVKSLRHDSGCARTAFSQLISGFKDLCGSNSSSLRLRPF